MAASTIGARIRELRGKVLTQRQLADAAGVSIDVIRKLEQGSRQTAAIATLQKLAQALDVDIAALVSEPAALAAAGPTSGVVAIRRALTPVDDLLGESLVEFDTLAVSDARRTVDYAWGAYWGGKYDLLGSLLPTAISQLRATAHAAAPHERTVAYELLARIYWAAGCTLVHLGHPDPAYQAIRHALEASRQGNDELLDATLRGSVAWQLLVQGRYDESLALAIKTAESLEPHGDVGPAHLSTYGSLILQGATAAGRAQQSQEAHALVFSAGEVAARLGTDRRDYETYFGPSQVMMQTVDVNVVTEDYAAAIVAARVMPAGNGLPLASRARHLADRALAHTRVGEPQKALDALLTAERIGPDWIKYQSLPRRIVSELLDGDGRSALRGFAKRLNVHD